MSSISGRGVAGPSPGGRVPTKITEFLSSGTWTKHPLTKWIEVFCYPGGTGGPMGFQCPVGQVASGSSGPGGSSVGTFMGPASEIPDTAAVTVGAKGLGGTSGTPTGTRGGISSFGEAPGIAPSIRFGYSGGLGEVGSVGAQTLGGFGADIMGFDENGWFTGFPESAFDSTKQQYTQFGGGAGGGCNADGTTQFSQGGSQYGGCGGASGGGITAGGVAQPGDYGGTVNSGSNNPASAADPGQDGPDGLDGTGGATGTNGYGGGAGVGEPGGKGGVGGFPGGQGGAGGNGYDTSLPGDGGDGAAGMVRIVEYF